ncbi:hypothetical protein C5Y96_06460 [Blastopirellula marina]|uniref:DUF8091 domain-containing protein n=1 Tax=Blastopirellula marina TaxID=124 RepID=A0A2S8FXA4_9BACT|nr:MULTISPECIES: hypothetical protein [Pirellulaceae]PQO36805.1 hypothetical protein C5Y96_06460 [Blastopirellula marina]RCS53520.1 hypothetical protein DTL36_06470 [Bremerella cremea]
METSLHKALKAHYAGKKAETEVRLGRYIIDAVARGQLIEVQWSGLAAIRDKIRELCDNHKVRVVKPIVARKKVVRRDKKGGQIVSARYSPKRCDVYSVFEELVHFTNVFPHENLTLEIPLVEIEEIRYPGHGKRRRKRENDFVVEDQTLTEIVSAHRFRKASDLLKLLPAGLPKQFHTGDVAAGLQRPRWIAQKMVYTLRKTGALGIVGKEGNAILYQKQSAKAGKKAA